MIIEPSPRYVRWETYITLQRQYDALLKMMVDHEALKPPSPIICCQMCGNKINQIIRKHKRWAFIRHIKHALQTHPLMTKFVSIVARLTKFRVDTEV